MYSTDLKPSLTSVTVTGVSRKLCAKCFFFSFFEVSFSEYHDVIHV